MVAVVESTNLYPVSAVSVMLAVWLVLYPAVVSLGVHVICGVVLLTPVVAQAADVSKVVFAVGVSIPVIDTEEISLSTVSVALTA